VGRGPGAGGREWALSTVVFPLFTIDVTSHHIHSEVIMCDRMQMYNIFTPYVGTIISFHEAISAHEELTNIVVVTER
jgi:hypothetical protein